MIEGKLNVTIKELNLALTLMSGQSFRWKACKSEANSWFGVIDKHVLVLQQCQHHVQYKLLNKCDDNCGVDIESSFRETNDNKRQKVDDVKHNIDDHLNQLLSDYFRLDVPLHQLYSEWSNIDDNFARNAVNFAGVRLLKQNPCENLFSFICSSNNNISRISKMVENLCAKYGQYLCDVNDFGPVFAFPDVNKLANDCVESELRVLGFGYRAKFIAKSAKMISEKHPKRPEEWLLSLRDLSYECAHKSLTELPGIGAKVADCICLMSLNHYAAIPVDTHVWQIARTHYLPHLNKQKSLTDKAYKEIGDFFRVKFGAYAGWAHNVLFCAHLKQFNHLISK